ncbi:ABC transporter ATP-binding protein [Nesterenkonia lutea]|uniref:ABC-2 type transport system ATP-binding protein n=1 Tax=Nesterenkonia lutea TaxID=272919 RepID=A0ABR9JE29_9MICC|nr:ABC transporter ATP-binding protein [Nesterenkonia lutea]MBE1523752.1 ABC-2 type transport system ATP-binding protein [Nesterenkonia lutea]
MPQQPPCLTLRHVRYAVGSARSSRGLTEILRGVDLTARSGEVTVLLGPNGAGKTTTLSCAQGLLHPSQGTVQLLGQDPFRAGADLRARVGVMLQEGGLPQSVSPRALLKHVASLHRSPWPLSDLAQRLDMESFLNTSIRRLSGGQKQRVALAASLLGRPEVVFLDEPTAGLDPQSRQTVFELIGELREMGMGIILTTHLLEEAQKLADSVFILKDGAIVRHGTVAELTRTAADGPGVSADPSRRMVFTASRTLTRDEIAGAPVAIELDGGVGNGPGAAWMTPGLSGPGQLRELAAWWEQIDMMPVEVRMEARTLEDVFWEVSVS